MNIIKVKDFSNEYLEAIRRLVGFLTADSLDFSEADFRELLAFDSSHLFILKEDNSCIIGMLTMGIYRSPTGTKAWIEDVAVDETYRGKGWGRMLVQYAIDFAKSQHADSLMLTSNHSRIAANNLYQSIGFERKETNVYQIKF